MRATIQRVREIRGVTARSHGTDPREERTQGAVIDFGEQEKALARPVGPEERKVT
jgi:hypothetical protein